MSGHTNSNSVSRSLKRRQPKSPPLWQPPSWDTSPGSSHCSDTPRIADSFLTETPRVRGDDERLPVWNPTESDAAHSFEWDRFRQDLDIATVGPNNHEPTSSTKPEFDSIHPEYLDADITTLDRGMRMAHIRNVNQIEAANRADEAVIGKYLPSDIEHFFPCQWIGPEDVIENNEQWLETLLDVARTPCPTPSKPAFIFEMSEAAM